MSPRIEPEPQTGGEADNDPANHARYRARRARAFDDEVTRLPRGRGIKLSSAQLFKIVMTATLLVLLIVVQRPCAEGVSKFVTEFDHPGSGAAAIPAPGSVDGSGSAADQYELIRPDMTEAERDAAIKRALAKRGSAAASGSGASR